MSYPEITSREISHQFPIIIHKWDSTQNWPIDIWLHFGEHDNCFVLDIGRGQVIGFLDRAETQLPNGFLSFFPVKEF